MIWYGMVWYDMIYRYIVLLYITFDFGSRIFPIITKKGHDSRIVSGMGLFFVQKG